jgi:Fanconi anemia group D2 protein
MPTLDLYFLHDTHGTKQLLTVLQKSTRLLQSLCNMVKKDQKHMSCIRLVPALKRTLEMLMCRAKVMVDVNNCPANVFCIGQLKAKDLKGNELSDLTYRQQQEEEEENESSTMEDDDSNDVQPDQDEEDDEEEQEEEEEEE